MSLAPHCSATYVHKLAYDGRAQLTENWSWIERSTEPKREVSTIVFSMVDLDIQLVRAIIRQEDAITMSNGQMLIGVCCGQRDAKGIAQRIFRKHAENGRAIELKTIWTSV